MTRTVATRNPLEWHAIAIIVLGAALYLWSICAFAVVGRGTPGPWDAPRHLDAVGPYRWVRNPIYVAALTIVSGEAWLFLSLQLLVYARAMAIFFPLFVIGYEEPKLQRRFGAAYDDYRQVVPRWILRRRQ